MAAAGHAFHPTLLREYDIRGIVGTTLHTADARAIGQAFGTMVVAAGGRKVVLGYDGRLSSPELAAATCAGFMAAGLEVLQIGMGPTPMMYFAVHHLGADGGLQITGSHNPPDYNGFKMMLGTKPFYGAQIQQIGQIASTGAYAAGEGRETRIDVFPAYLDRLVQDYHGTRPLSVVWDAGNGAAGPAMAALAARLPGRHQCLFAEVDGNFPNHHPDPTEPHNLEALIHEVTTGGYELGIGFDGDGDRIGVVDGQGRIVFGDQILQILAADVLARHPGAVIIADVKTSQTFFDEVARLGGRPLMWKTGHSPDQGQDGRGRRPAVGRDVRPHLLPGRLLRPRRRALRRRPPARHPGPRHRDHGRPQGRHARGLQHPRGPLRLPRGAQVHRHRRGQGKPGEGGGRGERHRRRAGEDRGRLVAGARVEHPGGAGGARGGGARPRGWSG